MVLSKSYTPAERGRIANITSMTVLMILIAAALTDEALLHSMGTSLASFRIGGGIVLMALAMLQAQPDLVRSTPSEAAEAEDKQSIAVVPLAIPLLDHPRSKYQ